MFIYLETIILLMGIIPIITILCISSRYKLLLSILIGAWPCGSQFFTVEDDPDWKTYTFTIRRYYNNMMFVKIYVLFFEHCTHNIGNINILTTPTVSYITTLRTMHYNIIIVHRVYVSYTHVNYAGTKGDSRIPIL